MVSLEEIKKLALLARIELGKKESEELQKSLGAILDYVSRLQKSPPREIETGVLPENHAPEIFNASRGDEPIEDKSSAEKGKYVKVKHIF